MGRTLAHLVLSVVLLGCGASTEPTSRRARHDGAALPELGAIYEVSHRVVVRFDEAERGSLRARLSIEVTERRAHDVSLVVRAFLLAEDRSIAAYDELAVGLDAAGHMLGPVRSRCADPAFDELASTRLVESILGSRPARLESDALEGLVITEIDEARAPAVYARTEEAEDPALLALRAETQLSLHAARLFGVTYRGDVTAIAQHHLSTDDLLEGRSRVRLRGEVERRPGGRGLFEVESDTEIRRTSEPVEGPERCAGGFSSGQVVALLHTHHAAFRSCYEDALSVDPELHGSFRIELVIAPDGHVASSVASGEQHDLPPWPTVLSCVTDLISGFVLAEGPPEPTTFAVPLVFEPEEPAP